VLRSVSRALSASLGLLALHAASAAPASAEPASASARAERALAVAGAVFSNLDEQSPWSPLGQSATNLRERLYPGPDGRRWTAALSAGLEFDSDAGPAGEYSWLLPPSDEDSDGRGLLRARASYDFIGREDAALALGYDGFLSLHFDENDANTQTHSGWLSGSGVLGPFRLGARVDYAYSMDDTSDAFRGLLLATPSLAWRPTDWALGYLYYQFQGRNSHVDGAGGSQLDGDGYRQLVGVYQLFFLPAPFSFVRLGVLGDFQDTQGREWDYDGVEASMGCGYDFPYEFALTWLYRFAWRDFENDSLVARPPLSKQREDLRHVLSVDLRKTFARHWEVALAGSVAWNVSNVARYDDNRLVGGASVTYRF
jgi:hypothetical protein